MTKYKLKLELREDNFTDRSSVCDLTITSKLNKEAIGEELIKVLKKEFSRE